MTTQRDQWDTLQKNFYNSREHRRMWYDSRSLFVDRMIDKFISFLEVTPQEKILEIGCGAGRYTLPLLLAGYSLTGIDISQRMLKKFEEDAAQLKIPSQRYRLLCTDLHSFNINGDEKFDAVIGFNILHHVFNIRESLKIMVRCLNRGGKVAFLEPNALNPLHYVDTLLDRGWCAERHKFNSLPEHIASALTERGFHHVEYRRFGFFPPFLINFYPLLSKTENWIEQRRLFNRVLPYD